MVTPDQIDIIQTTWKIPAANPVDSGEVILLKFFEKFPHNQQKFLAFKNLPLESLKGSKSFRTHAGRVVTVINDAIGVLGSPDAIAQLEEMWGKIGETHSKRKISKDSFNELKIVICEVLTAVCALDEVQQKAWDDLFSTIYEIIFKKYDQ
ncbi:Globin CTT-VI [Pseudolycoriella hygida]|uniref:Globin CTT-VI n=1 Tax=Pseudolycoriella hygida TaxID=35572 RepID=A0A9Q0MRU3_9DIPT|nr:Globin CTT-VI [Pseudolycoriella hygida]